MDGFQREYMRTQTHNHNIKFIDASRRALITGMRSKIKSVEHRPDLLIMQRHQQRRGGDYRYTAKDETYYPTKSAFEKGAVTHSSDIVTAGAPSIQTASLMEQMFTEHSAMPTHMPEPTPEVKNVPVQKNDFSTATTSRAGQPPEEKSNAPANLGLANEVL
jgi:hypothetical protein